MMIEEKDGSFVRTLVSGGEVRAGSLPVWDLEGRQEGVETEEVLLSSP